MTGRWRCKGNYAQNVKPIMSTRHTRRVLRHAAIVVIYRTHAVQKDEKEQNLLDTHRVWDIIIFTDNASLQTARFRQTRRIAPQRHSPSASATGDRPFVSGPSILRCPRSDAGEIRDAAQGRSRGRTGQHGGHGLRFVEAILLPGAVCLPTGRLGRPGASEARPATRPQIERRGAGVPWPAPRKAAGDRLHRDGRAGAGTVRHCSELAQYRTPSAAQGKKNELSPTPPVSCENGSGTLRYEELRQQVISGDSRGPGLAILLSRGMQAWLAVVGAVGVRNAPPQTQIATETGPLRTVPGECRAQITAVLAGMVLHGWQQGRHA